MRFDYSQQMRLGQHMKLAPRMIQSMEILQMPLAELQERIEQELENNPTLEITERHGDRATLDESRDQADRDDRENERSLRIDEKSGQADFERLDSFESANPDLAANSYSEPTERRDFSEFDRAVRRRDSGEDEFDAIAAAPDRGRPISDQLLDQWHLAEVDEPTRLLGELIINFLEEDGSLKTPLATIADRAPADLLGPGTTKPTEPQLETALASLQRSLEPVGIAARTPRETLLLQLDALEREHGGPALTDRAPTAIARALIEHHLENLAQNRMPRVVEQTGLTLEQIKLGLEIIRKFSLNPGKRLVEERPSMIVPDAIVEYDEEGDRYFAYLNERRLPNLRLNREYALMSKDRGVVQKDRDYLKTHLGNAQWLIDAVQQRKRTLLRVLDVVLKAQREYFDFGPQALKPLPMTQVADEIGVHVATVSRAVAEKYIQTPRGVVSLRKFFTGGLATDSGQDMSYDAVKAALKEAIDAEDKSKPLSDDALVAELKKKGIEIARRTVAKYRDQLGVPTARLRKAF